MAGRRSSTVRARTATRLCRDQWTIACSMSIVVTDAPEILGQYKLRAARHHAVGVTKGCFLPGEDPAVFFGLVTQHLNFTSGEADVLGVLVLHHVNQGTALVIK